MEYKMKCNVCGKVFCYTDEDLKKNTSNAGMAALSAIGGLASALGGGTVFHTHHLQGQSDRYNDKVIDYSQCPYCHSRSLSAFTGNAEEDTKVVKTVNINTSASTESLLKRVFIFLEDGEWETADAYCEACLDKDPESAKAYLGKLMAELHVKIQEELKNQEKPFDSNANYRKAIRYGDDELRNTLVGYTEYINNRNENARKDKVLRDAKSKMTGASVSNYDEALSLFATIPGWKDADEQKSICISKIAELKAKEEADRLERERLAEIERIKAAETAKKNKKVATIVVPILVVLIVVAVIISNSVKKSNTYKNALILLEAGKYDDAIAAFSALGEYKDSAEQIKQAEEKKAEEAEAKAHAEEKKAEEAEAKAHADAYAAANALMAQGRYAEAGNAFLALGDYNDSANMVVECGYQQTMFYLSGNTDLSYPDAQQAAYDWLTSHKDYKDSLDYLEAFVYRCVLAKTIYGSTNEIGNWVEYRYDSTGSICSYDNCYPDDKKDIVSTYTIQSVKQYGNWYVYEILQSNYDVYSYISYLEPFAGPIVYTNNFTNSGEVDWSSVKWAEDVLYVTIIDDDEEYTYKFFENGNYEYTKYGNGDYVVNHTVTVKFDEDRNIISITDSGRGTAHNGTPYTIVTANTYLYNEHGHWTSSTFEKHENWNGKLDDSNWSTERVIQYDEAGNIISIKINQIEDIYEYAFVYCPDA